MDKTSKMGLEGQVSSGWIHKGMALQAAGIQGTKAGTGESTEHERWRKWSSWSTMCNGAGRR